MPPTKKKKKMPPTKNEKYVPFNLWSIQEIALMLFLRSRRVSHGQITIILNERYAPVVRRSGAVRGKMKSVRVAQNASGQIDLTYDPYFRNPENVDPWIRDQVDNPDELSRLLTFTEHELEVMGTNVPTLNNMRGGSLVVAGPSPVRRNPGIPRPEKRLPKPEKKIPRPEGGIPRQENIQPWMGPSHMPAGQEPRRGEYYGPGAGPRQVLDPRARQVMDEQGQMSGFPTPNPNLRPNGAGWPVWDATLESLFPNMGPPSFYGGFSFVVEQAAGSGAAQDPYQESRDFEQWHSQEKEVEGEDEDDEDGDEEDGESQVEDSEDDDSLNEYRPQRDENDNCWYDEDQEELDG